jgi:hypothetical protein
VCVSTTQHRRHVSPPITLAHSPPNFPTPRNDKWHSKTECLCYTAHLLRGAWHWAQVSGTGWRFLLSNCYGIGTRGSWIRHQPLTNAVQPAANHNLVVSLSYSAAINIVVTRDSHCAAGRAASVLMALVPNQPYAEGGTLNGLAGNCSSYRTRRFIPVISTAAPLLRRVFSTLRWRNRALCQTIWVDP